LSTIKNFFNSSWLTLLRRGSLLTLINVIYFGSILICALLKQLWFPPTLKEESIEFPHFMFTDWGLPALVLSIFLFNLLISGFILTTLTGLVFFALPLAILVWRATIWSMFLSALSTQALLIVLPTIIFEGEGYVLTATAGVILGLSWLKPSIIYGNEPLSRSEALKKALKEAIHIFAWAIIILFVAALIEGFTITYLLT
jgi:uncharacterized membrane protein SpoIIM required for sporulation